MGDASTTVPRLGALMKTTNLRMLDIIVSRWTAGTSQRRALVCPRVFQCFVSCYNPTSVPIHLVFPIMVRFRDFQGSLIGLGGNSKSRSLYSLVAKSKHRSLRHTYTYVVCLSFFYEFNWKLACVLALPAHIPNYKID